MGSDAASDLARRVDRSDYMPEVIVAPSERGAMVAHLVARELRTQVPIVTVAVTKLAIANRKGPDFHARESRDLDFYFPWGKAE